MSEASLWAKLRQKGFSEKATAAIMGNMQAESGLIPYRLQGDFTSGYERSIDYTRRVDNGEISRNEFLYNGPGGGGYGLVQWTYWSRKAGLYDLAKSRGVSVGDEQLGVDWFYQEVQQGEYRKTWNALNGDGEIQGMTTVMLRDYEKPYDQSYAAVMQRTEYANQIYKRNAGTTPDIDPEPSPQPSPEPIETSEITVPTLKKGDKDTSKGGDKGVAVTMLQTGLKKNGISLGVWGADGDFGATTENAVKKFQSMCNLSPDGIVGHDTWQILFQ